MTNQILIRPLEARDRDGWGRLWAGYLRFYRAEVANEVTEGTELSDASAPRLSTFVWSDGDWQLLSHANFNAPA
jgi:hypothetical protein